MLQIGVAAYSGHPSPRLLERCRVFVDALVEACKDDLVLILGGYWGLMRCVVDQALAKGVQVVLLPPMDREEIDYPRGAIVVRTGSGPRLRSVYLVRSSDVLVALGGGAGTLQEIITAYTEAKPVYVLGDTGLATDKFRESVSPYADERKTAPITYVDDEKELARRACVAARTRLGTVMPQRG